MTRSPASAVSRSCKTQAGCNTMAPKAARLRKFIISTKAEIDRAACAIIEVADGDTEADTIREMANELSVFLDRLSVPEANSLDPIEIVHAVRLALFLGGWEDVIPGRTAQRKGANARKIPESLQSNIDRVVVAAVRKTGCKPSKTRKAATNILPVAVKIAQEQGVELPLTPNAVLESLRRIKIDRDQ